jgi:hypothetical protein
MHCRNENCRLQDKHKANNPAASHNVEMQQKLLFFHHIIDAEKRLNTVHTYSNVCVHACLRLFYLNLIVNAVYYFAAVAAAAAVASVAKKKRARYMNAFTSTHSCSHTHIRTVVTANLYLKRLN